MQMHFELPFAGSTGMQALATFVHVLISLESLSVFLAYQPHIGVVFVVD